MRLGDLRRLRAAAEAAWAAASRAEADRLLAVADPAARARAYEDLTRRLAEGGDALPPADAERVRRSFGTGPTTPGAAPAARSPPASSRPRPPVTPITLAAAERHWRAVADWTLAAAAAARGPTLGVGDARARLEAAGAKAVLSDPALRARPPLVELHADRRAAVAALAILGQARACGVGPEAVLPGVADTLEEVARGAAAVADAARRAALRREGVSDRDPSVAAVRRWWTEAAERRATLDWPALLLATGQADDFADAAARVARAREGDGHRPGAMAAVAAAPEAQRVIAAAEEVLRACERVEALGGATDVLAGCAVDAAALRRALESAWRAAEERERAARRARWLAERAAAEHFARMRRLAPIAAVAAALAPAVAATWFWGWGPGGLLGVALDVFALPAVPLLAGLAAAAGAGLAAWLTARATSHGELRLWLGAAFAAGVAAVVCARALPVHLAREGAVVAGGRSLAGAVVRVEYAAPTAPRVRGVVVWGNGEVRGGTVLDYTGGDPVRHLRGG